MKNKYTQHLLCSHYVESMHKPDPIESMSTVDKEKVSQIYNYVNSYKK